MESRVVYKYNLSYGYEFTTEYSVPAGASFLDVQLQGENACVWAECDPEQPHTPIKFRMVPTGQIIDLEDWDYIGTVQQFHLVWHIYYQWGEW